MDYGDTVNVLRSMPIFTKLDAPALKLLAFSSSALLFEDGEDLFSEGDPADSVYFIEDGRVGIWARSGDNEIKVNTLGRHEMFGEMAIFRNSPRSATIRAEGAVKVVKIDADIFLRLVTRNPEAALGIMQLLSEKLARTTETYERLEDRVRSLEKGAGRPAAAKADNQTS